MAGLVTQFIIESQIYEWVLFDKLILWIIV